MACGDGIVVKLMLLLELYAFFTMLYTTSASTYQIKCDRQDVEIVDNVFRPGHCNIAINLPCKEKIKFPSPIGCDEYMQCYKDSISVCRCLRGTYFVPEHGRCLTGRHNDKKCLCPDSGDPRVTGGSIATPPPTNATTAPTGGGGGGAKEASVLDIVGGVVGGLVLVVIIVMLSVVYVMWKKRRESVSKAPGAVENPEYTRKNSVVMGDTFDTVHETSRNGAVVKTKLAPLEPGRPLPQLPHSTDGNGLVPNVSNGGSQTHEYQKLIRPHIVHSEEPSYRSGEYTTCNDDHQQEEQAPLSPGKEKIGKDVTESVEMTYRSS